MTVVNYKTYRQTGFTLIEMSLGLLLIGILIAGSFKLSGSFDAINKSKQAEKQMIKIKQALFTYLKVNRHLPCPDTDDDGKENRKLQSGISVCNSREGTLPFRDLAVASEDGWGNPFYYRVNARAENKNYINDYCQSASVFGQSGVGSKPNKGGLCTTSQIYYCDCSAAKSDGACPGLCDFNNDPRALGTNPGNSPPYFMLDTPPVGVDNTNGLKNMVLVDENDSLVANSIVAMVVSFGENGTITWDNCQANTQANSIERKNCDGDQAGEFAIHSTQSFDDYLAWMTLFDAKQAMIDVKGLDYD